jgi:hypothetical protein
MPNMKDLAETSKPHEAVITINGVRMTPGQSMVIRVAVMQMHAEMAQPLALGSDDRGISLATTYHRLLTSIIAEIMAEPPVDTEGGPV